MLSTIQHKDLFMLDLRLHGCNSLSFLCFAHEAKSPSSTYRVEAKESGTCTKRPCQRPKDMLFLSQHSNKIWHKKVCFTSTFKGHPNNRTRNATKQREGCICGLPVFPSVSPLFSLSLENYVIHDKS